MHIDVYAVVRNWKTYLRYQYDCWVFADGFDWYETDTYKQYMQIAAIGGGEAQKPCLTSDGNEIYMIWHDILYYQNRFRLYSKHKHHGMNGKRRISIRQTKYLVKNRNNDKHECRIMKALKWDKRWTMNCLIC